MFDTDGYFVGETTCQESPLEPGVFLIPPSSTEIAPELKDGFFYRWDGSAWIEEKKPTCSADFEGLVISHTSQTPRDIAMRELIQKHCEHCETHRIVRGDDLSWSVERIPEKTEAEKLAEAEESVRVKRDSLISQTDYLLTPDYPISAEDLELVKAYRQALRDVPQQEGFPFDVVWPELPALLKE